MLYILHFKCLMECLNEFFIDFCFVDMSENPHRRRLGKETMTNNTRKEGWRRTIFLRREGGVGGVEGSHAGLTQVLHPTQDHYHVT